MPYIKPHCDYNGHGYSNKKINRTLDAEDKQSLEVRDFGIWLNNHENNDEVV